MSIYIFAILMFIFFSIIGYLYHNLKMWKYIDIIYYPLGTIGVVLLFIQQTSDREIFNLLEAKKTIEQRLTSIEKEKPTIDDYYNQDSIIDVHSELFSTISRMAKACQNSYQNQATPICMINTELAKVTKKYEPFFRGKSISRIEKLCSVPLSLFDEIEKNNALPNITIKQLRNYYIKGIRQGLSRFSYQDSENLLSEFEKDSKKKILTLLKDMHIQKHSLIFEEYIESIHSASNILRSFTTCMRAPKNILNGELRKWKSSKNTIKKTKDNIENKIYNLSDKTIQIEKNKQVVYIKYFMWPYIIIFIFALKFGKEIANIRKTSNKYEERNELP